MTADRILIALGGYLKPLAEADGGTLELSGTPQNTLELLRTGPARWRVILQWQRMDQVSKASALSMRFLVIVQQSKGLGVQPGRDVQTDRAGDPALLTRLHQVIDWVRAVKFQSSAIDSADMNPQAAYFLRDPESPTNQAAAEFVVPFGMNKLEDVVVPVPVPVSLNSGGSLQLNDGGTLDVR